MGLSPRARGKQYSTVTINEGVGPIPAGAGETLYPVLSALMYWAYPRGRGGNGRLILIDWLEKGLSPRARGKLAINGCISDMLRPIPAGAGETNHCFCPCNRHRAYPRGRGGNPSIVCTTQGCRGLSPRARGKLTHLKSDDLVSGPIPAGAGETPRCSNRRTHRRAYPRGRGGNGAMVAWNHMD